MITKATIEKAIELAKDNDCKMVILSANDYDHVAANLAKHRKSNEPLEVDGFLVLDMPVIKLKGKRGV